MRMPVKVSVLGFRVLGLRALRFSVLGSYFFGVQRSRTVLEGPLVSKTSQ